jgi:hypothetical protein
MALYSKTLAAEMEKEVRRDEKNTALDLDW